MTTPPLHQFISDTRGEILALAVQKMKARSPEGTEGELAVEFDVVIEEIVGALRKDAGIPDPSPLPGKSAAASRVGGQRQSRGYAVEKIALHFGTISESVGELGARRGYRFGAQEYRIFNSCIDTAIASALEQYSEQEHEQQAADTVQRIGFLAHELRNALSSARMAFNLLREGQMGIHSKTGAVLDRGLARLESLVSQTLLAVQLQAGVEVQRRRMKVAALLRDVAETAVPERGVQVHISVDGALEADIDERLLISAVSNLLQNAIKFTRSSGNVILRGRREGDAVLIEVEDECGGLPPGMERTLFEPYVQGGQDRRGLGLGLTITREAVDAHGASLSVRDLPGKGCVFSVRLPAI